MKRILIKSTISFLFIACFFHSAAGNEQDEEAIRAVLKQRQEAYRQKDYDLLWETWSEKIRQQVFRNDKEEMRLWTDDFLPPSALPDIYRAKVREVRLTGPVRAFARMDPPNPVFSDIYLVKEKAGWKVTLLKYFVNRAKRDLARIDAEVRNFHKAEGGLPSDLDSLLMFAPQIEGNVQDVFSDEKKNYSFVLRDNQWQIYSIGPDGDDDGALTAYDQANGELSDGDIVLTGSI